MRKKLILLVTVTFLLCGCGKTIPKLENGQEAVVTFDNGSMISIDELYGELKSGAYSVLVEMIDKKILEDRYKDDLDDAKEYAENYITSLKSYFKDDKGNYDENAFLNSIRQYYGYNTIEEFTEGVRIKYLRDKAVDEYVENELTDKEIEKYYKDEIVGDREVYHIQIIPEVKDTMTDDEKKEAEETALNEAKALIARLKKGEDFETIAKENSDDEATKEKGGNLGFINKGTYGSDEFDKEVYSLKVGNYSNTPVKTSKGYEIVYVKSEKDKKKLDEVKEKIVEALRTEKLEKDSTLQISGMQELRKSYGVKIVDTEINRDFDRYIENLIANAKEKDASQNEN